jgi:hypothetical protein
LRVEEIFVGAYGDARIFEMFTALVEEVPDRNDPRDKRPAKLVD